MASTFKNALSANVGTTPVDIYTVPASTATTVIGLSLANTSTSSQITATVTVTKGGTTVNLIKSAIIPVASSMIVIGGEQKLVMMAADKITVTSSLASSIDVALSFLEIA